MNNKIKDKTINWLESNQINGAFDGFPEENMNFKDLSDDELQWYYESWVLEDSEEKDDLYKDNVILDENGYMVYIYDVAGYLYLEEERGYSYFLESFGYSVIDGAIESIMNAEITRENCNKTMDEIITEKSKEIADFVDPTSYSCYITDLIKDDFFIEAYEDFVDPCVSIGDVFRKSISREIEYGIKKSFNVHFINEMAGSPSNPHDQKDFKQLVSKYIEKDLFSMTYENFKHMLEN